MTVPDQLIKLMNPNFEQDQERIQRVKAASHDLDAVINFRVSAVLKDEFNSICKDDQSTISRELKRYMLSVVKKGNL